MRLFTLTFAVGAAAAIVRRDLPTITTAFNAIIAVMNDFDTSVLALSSTGDIPSAVTDLTTKSQAIVSTINAGTANVTATSAIGLTDALNIVGTSSNLVSAVNKTVSDLISKQSIISGAGESGLVVDQLTQQRTASQGFIDAVTSKVPDSVRSIANQQASQVISSLNQGITSFGGTVKRMLRN